MTGFNMPPGCSPRDIPGNDNNPDEAVYDHLFDVLGTKVPEDVINTLGEWAVTLIREAYDNGYKDGQHDAKLPDPED